MVDPEIFRQDIDAVQTKLRIRLGARGKTLALSLRRAGRSLPMHARQAGSRLIVMQAMVAHPRLRRLVARSEVDTALAELSAPLNVIKLKDRRKDKWLKFAASVVFGMLVLAAAIIALMRGRGLI